MISFTASIVIYVILTVVTLLLMGYIIFFGKENKK